MILDGDDSWLIPVSLHSSVSQGTLAVAGLHTRYRVTPSLFESSGYSTNNPLVCQSTAYVYQLLFPLQHPHRLN
jgi:hypothetical protein